MKGRDSDIFDGVSIADSSHFIRKSRPVDGVSIDQSSVIMRGDQDN